jgi:hypothetical protein
MHDPEHEMGESGPDVSDIELGSVKQIAEDFLTRQQHGERPKIAECGSHSSNNRMDSGSTSLWNQCAIFRARASDRRGFRQHCRRMLEAFSSTCDPAIAERTAKACLLLPLAGPEQDLARKLADRALKMSRNHWVLP